MARSHCPKKGDGVPRKKLRAIQMREIPWGGRKGVSRKKKTRTPNWRGVVEGKGGESVRKGKTGAAL